MGAVRNSNTRASHASVEMASGTGESKGASGSGGGGGGGGGNGSGAMDSPHFAEGPDRRPSFSYLRRASERRRRLRMMERQDDDPVDGRYFAQPDEDQMDSSSRRDSKATIDRFDVAHRLKRSQQTYDEEADQEEARMGMLVDEERRRDADNVQHDEFEPRGGQDFYSMKAQRQMQQQAGDDHRRQSTNDRLTEAVSDVIDFVREESFKRGKRHSFHRRRQAAGGGFSAGSAHSGAGSHGTEGELDSDSARCRKRRVMRRSPRRSVAEQQRRMYINDSDTGSLASVGQDHQQQAIATTSGGDPMMPVNMRQQRLKMAQRGGSIQEGGMFYASGRVDGSSGQLMDQHRRHQSADACDPNESRLQSYGQQHARRQHPHGSGYTSDAVAQLDGSGQHDGRTSMDDSAAPTTASIIRPIQVGQSPPPMVGSADAELVAARRRRENEDSGPFVKEDDETAIHIGPERSDSERTKQSPVRFIAPKVAPLHSPSALIMPDEAIVPPDVPYRGRRLPQIPGSDIIRSAADFLHSSIYGRQRLAGMVSGAHSSVGGIGTDPGGFVVGPLVMGPSGYSGTAPYVAPASVSSPAEPVFPSVSESPTIKIETPIPPPAGIIKRQSTLEHQVGGATGSGDGITGVDDPGCIHFPRVSFSPTHGVGQQTGPVVSKYHSSEPSAIGGVAGGSSAPGAASMIATQLTGGTQSTVLASVGGTLAEAMMPERMAWTRNRRLKKEDEDDWF